MFEQVPYSSQPERPAQRSAQPPAQQPAQQRPAAQGTPQNAAPGTQPGARPAAQGATQSSVRPVPQGAAQSGARPASNPAARSAQRPAQPGAQPPARPPQRPSSQGAPRSVPQNTSRPVPHNAPQGAQRPAPQNTPQNTPQGARYPGAPRGPQIAGNQRNPYAVSRDNFNTAYNIGAPGTRSASANARNASAPAVVRSAAGTSDASTRAVARKSLNKAPIIAAIALAVVLIIVAIVVFVNAVGNSSDVELLPDGEKTTLTIPSGSGASTVGEYLAQAGLIANANAFTARVQELDAASQLQAGTYTFVGGTSLDDIIAQLQTGPGIENEVVLTIPEGYTVKRIAEAVEEATEGAITAAEFRAAAADSSVYAADYPFVADAGTYLLEGFLYPETYYITGMTTADEIIRTMLDQFAKVIATLDFSYPTSKGLSLYDALKLASIVQGEAATGEEGLIAGVFYNRLAIGMNLESCATTAYEVGGEPTGEQVHADTPYSTYVHPGLSIPTPVNNPGLTSLEAVCAPTETDYLYFLALEDENGKLYSSFSKTYEEHVSKIK